MSPVSFQVFRIEAGRDAKEMQGLMLEKGVSIGPSFPALDTTIRVSIRTDAEMAKFRHVLSELMAAA